jgi:S1-C subfamily serine protease
VRRAISAHIGGQVRPALELTAGVMPGDSGAPVVDGDGRVVGSVRAAQVLEHVSEAMRPQPDAVAPPGGPT